MGFWDRLRLAAYCAAWVNGDGVEQYVTDDSEADS
jgi:murein L,D-transpeptidase YcbB/YkuD